MSKHIIEMSGGNPKFGITPGGKFKVGGAECCCDEVIDPCDAGCGHCSTSYSVAGAGVTFSGIYDGLCDSAIDPLIFTFASFVITNSAPPDCDTFDATPNAVSDECYECAIDPDTLYIRGCLFQADIVLNCVDPENYFWQLIIGITEKSGDVSCEDTDCSSIGGGLHSATLEYRKYGGSCPNGTYTFNPGTSTGFDDAPETISVT